VATFTEDPSGQCRLPENLLHSIIFVGCLVFVQSR